MAWPSSFTTPPAGSGPAGHNDAHNELVAAVQHLKDNPGGGGGDTTAQVGTFVLPESPTEGQTVSILADEDTVIPEDITWDSGGEPTVTGRLLIACVWSGVDWVCTYGLPFTAAPEPPDETAPTAGTLGVVVSSTTADGTVTGATDETALDAAPYSFRVDAGTWTAWQAGATYEWTGLTAETEYDFQHRVRDAAGNITEGSVVTDTTDAAPADTTDPTPGTLASSSITDTSFTLTVSGASDETALHATPYAFSTDNGSNWSAYQAGASFDASGLTAETEYTCVHRVRDAAGNVAAGSSIVVETAAAATTASLSDAIMALSPAGYWKLDETSGTQATDSSGNAKHGTYVGSYTLAAQDGYATFSGGHVSVPDDNAWSVQTTGKLTVFIVARLTAITATRQFHISKGAASQFEWALEAESSTTAGRLAATFYASASGTVYQSEVTATAHPTGEWVALAFELTWPSAQGADFPVYMNSATALTTTSPYATDTGPPANRTAPIRIGGRGDGAGPWFGALSHAAIFPTGLSEAQREAIMEAFAGEFGA